MRMRLISLVIAAAMMFMAALPGVCAALCVFKACPEMKPEVGKTHPCCPDAPAEERQAPKCQAEMNKEAPTARQADAPTFSFDSIVLFLPIFISLAGSQISPSQPAEFPPPRDHSPPLAATGILHPRAPPIDR